MDLDLLTVHAVLANRPTSGKVRTQDSCSGKMCQGDEEMIS